MLIVLRALTVKTNMHKQCINRYYKLTRNIQQPCDYQRTVWQESSEKPITSFSRIVSSVFNFLFVQADRANNLSANQLHKDKFFHQNTWLIYVYKKTILKFQRLSQIKVSTRTHKKEATLFRFPRKAICIVLKIMSSQHCKETTQLQDVSCKHSTCLFK